MGGSTVFGYEKDGGTVVYIITHGIDIGEIYESKYISERTVPPHGSKSHYRGVLNLRTPKWCHLVVN